MAIVNIFLTNGTALSIDTGDVRREEVAGLLLAEPSLHPTGLRLMSQGCNEQRRIQIKRQ